MSSRFASMSFLSRGETVIHQVNGEDLTFSPLSFSLVVDLKSLVEPAAGALALLFAQPSNDTRKQRNDSFKRDPGTDQIAESESFIVNDAITLEMARYRDEQVEKAIKAIVGMLINTNTQHVLAKIILNSLRSSIGAKNPVPDECAEFISELDLNTLVQLLEGVVKANRKLFGPLEPKARGFLRKVSAEESLAEAEEAIEEAVPQTRP